MSHEPLRVSLADLHTAESRGKWWLVGAAWSGDPLVDNASANTEQPSKAPERKEDPVTTTENALLKIARQQGMNTDIRRSIFVVMMSSDVRSQHPMFSWMVLTWFAGPC